MRNTSSVLSGSETVDAVATPTRILLTAGLVATALVAVPEGTVGPDVFKSAIGGVLILLALAVWLWGQQGRRKILWHPFLCVPASLALYAAISATWSSTGAAFIEAGRWSLIAVILFLAINTARQKYFQTITYAMHWACVMLSVIALAQFWFGLDWFPASAAPGSTFGNRNFFAELLAASLPLSLWLLIRSKNFASSVRNGLGFSLIIVALMSTGTRAALIAAIAGFTATILLIFCTKHRNLFFPRPRVFFATLIIVLITTLGLGSIPSTNDYILRDHTEMQTGRTAIERTAKRLHSLVRSDTYEDNSSFGIRRAAWSAARQMIQAYPIRGIGAGGWNYLSPLYMPSDLDTQAIWMAHNEPMQLVVEYGLVGWAALLLLIGLVGGATARNIIQLRGASQHRALHSVQLIVIVISMMSMGITSLSGLPLHAAATCYLLAIYMSLIIILSAKKQYQETNNPFFATLWPSRLLGVFVLLAGVAIAIQAIRFDYFVRQGAGTLTSLSNLPTPQNNTKFTEIRDKAFFNIERGLEIYPEHALVLMPAIGSMIKLKEYDHAAVYLEKVLAETPYLVELQCQKSQAYANSKRFEEAEKTISEIQALRPGAHCLTITKFIFAYNKNDFFQVVNLGKSQFDRLRLGVRKDETRYLVDYTYRAAIRIADWDTALNALKIRATLWPELRTSSWLLVARLQAELAQNRFSPEALEAYKKALSSSTNLERQQILRDMPSSYRDAL